MRQVIISNALVVLLLTTMAAGRAEVPEAEQETAATSTLMTLSSRLTLSVDSSDLVKAELLPRPVLHWSNPIRKSPAGGTFLWTVHGRPIVAMCSYPNLGNVDYEFQSLSEFPLLAKDQRGRTIWQPREAGVNITELADVVPLKTRARRNIQLRRVASKFTAAIVKGSGEKQRLTPLRLLPTPLYRYPEDVDCLNAVDTPNGDRHGNLIDGALFCFVQSTDPEVLLMLEVWENDDEELSYTYSLGRMSVIILQATYGNSVVWKTRWGNKGSKSEYHTVQTKDKWPGDR